MPGWMPDIPLNTTENNLQDIICETKPFIISQKSIHLFVWNLYTYNKYIKKSNRINDLLYPGIHSDDMTMIIKSF